MTIICTIFLLWTAVTESVLSIFSCVHVDEHPSMSPVPSPVSGYWLLQARALLVQPLQHITLRYFCAQCTLVAPSPLCNRTDQRHEHQRLTTTSDLIRPFEPSRLPPTATQDMTQRCFHGAHFRYAMIVGVPGILIFCVGVPVFMWLRMRLLYHAKRLSSAVSIRTFGFLCASSSSSPPLRPSTVYLNCSSDATVPAVCFAQGVRPPVSFAFREQRAR